ncbi:MAG: transposase domain-containing protein [Simplicispira sp.]|nr:transposase domain-containing protein [Simplicispira sp.]
MSFLQSALRQTLARTPERLDQLASLIDPAWIEQALNFTGKSSIRRRKLPVWQVVQQLIEPKQKT